MDPELLFYSVDEVTQVDQSNRCTLLVAYVMHDRFLLLSKSYSKIKFEIMTTIATRAWPCCIYAM